MAKSAFTVPFYPIATPKEIARARRDAVYRRKLLVSNLQNLIGLMAAMRSGPDADHPDLAPLLREGAELAAQMSDAIKALPMPESDDD